MEKLVQKAKSKVLFNLFTLAIRYLLGGAFLFASLPKIMGMSFTQISANNPVGAFFECLYQLPLYWSFLGWSQILAALLLITHRFALLGAMIFFPIILNIFFITVSLHMQGTPYVTFLMLLATAWLLLWDFDKWKNIFLASPTIVQSQTEPAAASRTQLAIFAMLGLAYLITGLVFLVYLKKPLFWLLITGLATLAALILSIRQSKDGHPIRI